MAKVRYLFSINPGRSGSKYLTALFEHVEGVVSAHEPFPQMNGAIMQAWLKGKPEAMRQAIPEKVAAINKRLGSDDLYVETNHCFVKGFGFELPDHGIPREEIGIVILKRNPEDVAKSLFKVGATPVSNTGRKWLINPPIAKPHTAYPDALWKFPIMYAVMGGIYGLRRLRLLSRERAWRPTFVQRYEMAFLRWYVDEIWRLGTLFRERFPDIPVFETTIRELNDPETLPKMLAFFGLDLKLKPSYYEQVGKKVNSEEAMKAHIQKIHKREQD